MNFFTLCRFVTVGVMGLCINEGLLIALKGYAGLPLFIASALAVETAIICQFFCNDRWTFRAGKDNTLPRSKRFITYQSVSLGALVINNLILNALVIYTGMDYRIANIAGICIAFFWNVTINFAVTWKKKENPKPTD